MCHFVHMKRISIRELHLRTGDWIRRTIAEGRIVVTDHGRPVASLVPYEQEATGTRFSSRRLLPEFVALPRVAGESTFEVSDDRDRT
jgi:prevent-host-death family protein